jgi:hypothetical protein
VEEIMRIKQAIIPAILALSAAGSILVGSLAPAIATQASSTAVVAVAAHGSPNLYYHD